MTLSGAAEKFLEHCAARRMSPDTLVSYKSDLALLVSLATFKATNNVVSFTPDLVTVYFKTLADKGLAASTLHRRHASVRQFARWCFAKELVAKDPTVGLPTIRRPKKQPRPFAPDAQSSLEALPLTGEEALIRELLFGAGLRASEVAGLKVANVVIGATEHDGYMTVRGKGDKERQLALQPELRRLLKAHLDERKRVIPIRGAEYVLEQPDGRPWTRKMVWRRTKKWGRAANLPGVTTHRFRHTFGTRLLEEGADLREVQELMGHADISTTAIYTEVTKDRMRAAIMRIAKPVKVLSSSTVPPPPEGLQAQGK